MDTSMNSQIKNGNLMKKNLTHKITEYKVVMVGEPGVGKSSLMLKFTQDTFLVQHKSTVGVSFGNKIVQIQDRRIRLQLWDTAGQQKYRSIVKNFYRHAAAVILVYNITKKNSFEMMQQWMDDAKDSTPRGALYFMVGTHYDVDSCREVNLEDAINWGLERNIRVVCQVSCLTGYGVSELFEAITRKLIQRETCPLPDLTNGESQLDTVGGAKTSLKGSFEGRDKPQINEKCCKV